uniref:Integrase core domain containing protein n=1 Tax=Solanum tuberosum TaxID=4113 RepID=M1DP46_SOLTU
MINFDSDGIEGYDELVAALARDERKNLQKIIVQWSTDSIDGSLVHQRTVDGIRRSQVTLRTVGHPTDRRSGSVGQLHTNFVQVSNNGVDYSPLFHRRTVLHIRGSHIRDPILGTLTYGRDPRVVVPSMDRSTTSSADSEGSSDNPVPTSVEPAPKVNEPNRWCVPTQYQLYINDKMLNEHERMTSTVTEERSVLTCSLHTTPAIDELFRRH